MDDRAASLRQECRRCGSFAPAGELDRDHVCEDCHTRLSELERVPPTVFNVLLGAGGLLLRLGLPALLLTAATALPTYIFRERGIYIPFIGWGLDVLVQGVLLALAHRVVQGRRPDLGASVRVTADHLVPLLGVAVLTHLQLVLIYAAPSVLAFLVGFLLPEAVLWLLLPAQLIGFALALWRASSLAIALPIALHEHNGGLSALSASTRLIKGHRAPALMFALTGVIWLLVPVLYHVLLGVAAIIESLGEVIDPAVSGPWLSSWALHSGTIEIVHVVVSALAMLLMTSVSAVLYAKTVRYRVY